MIHFLVVSWNREPIATYQRTWGKSIADRLSLMTYDELPLARELRPGTYIFCDVDLITTQQRSLAEEVWKQLASRQQGFRILNHPCRSLPRYELLQLLRQEGINNFNAYPYTSPHGDWRYPVFIRNSADHAGSRTEMIQNGNELDRDVVRLVLKGVPIRNLLVTEFCDVSDGDGTYRKYSAFRIADRIVPRHIVFSKKWVLKAPDLVDPEKLQEELKYLEGNPHVEELRHIFDLAHIQYGRIDYGLQNGKIQVWEINTNPFVLLAPERYQAGHMPHQEWFAERILPAFRAIDLESGAVPSITLLPAKQPAPGAADNLKTRSFRSRAVSLLAKVARWPIFRPLRQGVQNLLANHPPWVLRFVLPNRNANRQVSS